LYFAVFISTFFSPAKSNIALPFFAGCKGNYIFIFCNGLANNSSIKAVKLCKSAGKICNKYRCVLVTHTKWTKCVRDGNGYQPMNGLSAGPSLMPEGVWENSPARFYQRGTPPHITILYITNMWVAIIVKMLYYIVYIYNKLIAWHHRQVPLQYTIYINASFAHLYKG